MSVALSLVSEDASAFSTDETTFALRKASTSPPDFLTSQSMPMIFLEPGRFVSPRPPGG